MKIRRIFTALFMGIILCTGILETPAETALAYSALSEASLAQTAINPTKKTAAKTVQWPSGPNPSKLSSDSAIVMEISTGTILYEKKSHKTHYPASITKILTSLLVLENCSLSETVTFSEAAIHETEIGSSSVWTEIGEKMTIEQCLYAIMLESANEVCRGVAEHISGDVPGFVKLMNKKVKELGLKDTHFNNPNGLPDTKHYTTAYDMAVISRTAFLNSTFRKICGTKNYICAKTNKHKYKRPWINHHEMVNPHEHPKYGYKYAAGGKTGYTIVSRSTLVTFAEKDGMQLVCVIMKAESPKNGEPNEYTDSTSLLNYGFEKYKKHTINEENTNINEDLFNNYGSYFNADESPIHLSNESAVILPKGVKLSQAKQKITYNNNVKINDGDNIIGTVTYTYGTKNVGSSNIIYTVSSSENHLDEASRNMVNDEITQIEATNEKSKNKNKHIQKMKAAIGNLFTGIPTFFRQNMLIFIIVLAALVLILFVVFIINHLKNRGRRGRISRNSGGYRSRGARRQHARRMKAERKNRSSGMGSSKRRRSRRHKSDLSFSSGNNSRKRKRTKSGLHYSKQHKNTKESFGKNFFDF